MNSTLREMAREIRAQLMEYVNSRGYERGIGLGKLNDRIFAYKNIFVPIKAEELNAPEEISNKHFGIELPCTNTVTVTLKRRLLSLPL